MQDCPDRAVKGFMLDGEKVWKAMGTETYKNQLGPDRSLKGSMMDWTRGL